MTLTPTRNYAPGIGDAVADRTINRTITEHFDIPRHIPLTFKRRDDLALDQLVDEHCRSMGYEISGYHVDHGDGDQVTVTLKVLSQKRKETWADVAERVALGNARLAPAADQDFEFNALHKHLRQASLLMSGRHLQHGDATQPERNMEVFTNCATSAASFLSFYLLLNGSGIGRAYDDAMMKVDWRDMPIVVPVIDGGHADVLSGEINALDLRNAYHLYQGSDIIEFVVPDSREGWAQACEKLETLTFEGVHRDSVLLVDFSQVRPRGAPIGGMQDRPASGPGPLMEALRKTAAIRESQMDPWRQAMYIDHYLSECVLVGGARRAARMSTKTWRDENVLEFIEVKRGGFLWSSNNSVTVDEEFWELVQTPESVAVTWPTERFLLWDHAQEVIDRITYCAYHDGTGEPGIINQHKLSENRDGLEQYQVTEFVGSSKYQLDEGAKRMLRELAAAATDSPYMMITNPCGEISLIMLGGYCVIADVVPYHARGTIPGGFLGGGGVGTNEEWREHAIAWDNDAEDAFRTATRALIRTNTMDCLYKPEVDRTNRIGVGITGLHEYAWARFGYGWRDLINEERSQCFWQMLARFKRAVVEEAQTYSAKLGVVAPHTDTTIKPAGTTSKLFALSEGAHLPSMREYIRWVQFRNDDPLVEEYRAKGYPVRVLRDYKGHTIVGFPTQPEICKLGMGDKLVTAAEATPEEQYQYLRLLEKYWIRGIDADGNPLPESGNQVSYTLKYRPDELSYEEFRRTLIEGQATIRCCSVMPQSDTSAYEYQPEEAVTRADYERVVAEISGLAREDVGLEHVDCANGACPVDFNAA